jgi:hypothetical protein
MSTTYEIVTEAIIKQLESGVAPWRKPWRTGMPVNLVSKKEYRGINIFLLAFQGYGSRYWLTYRQAQALSGNIKKGEHGTKVVFWKIGEYQKENAETTEIETHKSILLRYYTVFNLEQCEGIESPEPKPNIHSIEQCESIVHSMPNPPAFEQDAQACYRPLLQVFADRLRKATRGADVAGRYGGDEFLAVLPECTSTGVQRILQRLDDLQADACGGKLRFNYSAGWTEYVPGESREELLKRADQALYANKRGSKELLVSSRTIGL